MENEVSTVLSQSQEIVDLFRSLQTADTIMQVQSLVEADFPQNGELAMNQLCIYQVKQLAFDEDYPHREAFENVLSSMNDEAFNFVYVLTGTKQGIELHIGVVKNQNKHLPILGKKLSPVDHGNIIENIFKGNFGGSILEKVKAKDLDKLIGRGIQQYDNAGVILGIPSVDEKEVGEKYDFQGIDRLINSMLGLEWRLVVVCEPVPKQRIIEIKESAYELYNRLSVWSKRTVQHSVNDSTGINFGKNSSDTKGNHLGYNTSSSDVDSYSSKSKGRSESHDESHTTGTSKGASFTKSSSDSVTIEIANKHAEEIMKYINEDLLKRLKIGSSKGLFQTSVYYMAKKPTDAYRLKAAIMSLFRGNKAAYSPLIAQDIDLSKDTNRDILRTYQSQYLAEKYAVDDALMLLGRPFTGDKLGLNTYLTTEEVSLLAGLPQKEVPGLALKEGVEFGLNENKIKQEEPAQMIHLGKMMQRGRKLDIPFYLAKDSMAKHTFIAGVTGSGKTTTCHKLLSGADMPFLVIEPAKTEYRTLIHNDRDITVFTLGNETVAPFRLNPFELIEGEIISAHVDMLKATFTSAFPMEASMPQLLEEAIYKCYEKKGWDVNTNQYTNTEKGNPFAPGADSFPIMSGLLNEMKDIVESKGFSERMKSDYVGSLKSRLSNLTVGSKGAMLNCQRSTDFRYIAHNKVILEMEELKSPEDKALFMGFILSRLSAVIKDEHRKNHDFRHLTLVEEAHRLLSKVEYGDSGSKKGAVETFTDLLAEVRKYGEGLIIVDQIPNKLASEVLKNTNTKIIHKILARDDKEVVGDTMLMDDKQKAYLSALATGQAIIFSEQTEKPVHVEIEMDKPDDDSGQKENKEVEDKVVKQRFEKKREQLGGCYQNLDIIALYPQFDLLAKKLSAYEIDREQCDAMRTAVNDKAKGCERKKREIWEVLIRQRESFSGKAMASPEDQDIRISELTDFFMTKFENPNFTTGDMRNNYTKAINSYLQ